MEKASIESSSVSQHYENNGRDSDSASDSSSSSADTVSSNSIGSKKEIQGEQIVVRVDPASCTESDGADWESGTANVQDTEECSQDKETGEHQKANGILSSNMNLPETQPSQRNKKRKTKHTPEPVSKIKSLDVNMKDKSSQTPAGKRKVVAQHQCAFCNKTFRDRYHLARHLLVHSGETAPDCEPCKKPRNCCDCVPHAAQYSLIKQHRCDVCNKTFRDKYHLNRHYLVHTKEKPYQCEVCLKQFSRKDKRTQHSVLHH